MRRPGSTAALVLIAVLAVLALWRWQALREAEALRTRLEAEVAALLEGARSRSGVPGLSAAFALPGLRGVGAATAGQADTERRMPMTRDTRFLAGSVGKSLHAALALALHGEGRLDLDAPISTWIGGVTWFERLPNAGQLTLRHLLQHRSGLVDHLKTPRFWTRSLLERLADDEDALLAPDQLVAIALDRRPEFAAGKGFAYGDTNYVLAGLVIEHATGESAFSLIEQRLLEPLGLEGIVAARSRRVPGLAAGYQLPVNPFLLPPKIAEGGELRVHPMNESTAGGFATTPSAVVAWATALFEERALPGRYLDELVGDPVPSDDGRSYGLGVWIYDTPLGTAWGHGGYFPGYRSVVFYLPETRLAVCVQANRDFAIDVDEVALDTARLLLASTGSDP